MERGESQTVRETEGEGGITDSETDRGRGGNHRE